VRQYFSRLFQLLSRCALIGIQSVDKKTFIATSADLSPYFPLNPLENALIWLAHLLLHAFFIRP